MLPGLTPVGVYPVATLPPLLQKYVTSPFSLFVQDPDANLLFLVEVAPGDVATPGGVMLRFSDVGYITTPTDSPANTPYSPRLLTVLNYQTEVPRPGFHQSGGTASFGVIEFANHDGEYDEYLEYSWGKRQIDVLAGGTFWVGTPRERELTFAEFGLVYRGQVSKINQHNGVIGIVLNQSVMARLDKSIQENLYDSSAGDNEDKPKPLCYGECYNVPPVLIDATWYVYQVHDGPVQSIDAVRDDGNNLPPDTPADSGGTQLGATTVPAAGTFITDLSRGQFQVGTIPGGSITADVHGDDSGAGYVQSTADIVKRIIVDKGGLTDPDELDGASFQDFEYSGAIGYYVGPSPRTILQIVSEILNPVGWFTVNRANQFVIGNFVSPESETATGLITDEQVSNLGDEDAEPPVKSVSVGYKKVWAMQSFSASTLPPATQEFYANEFRFANAADATVLDVYKDAVDIEHFSLFVSQSDAQSLADILLARLKVKRRLYVVRLQRMMFNRRIGEVLSVQVNESDLSGGRNLFVHGIAEVFTERTVDLRLWG